MRIAGLVFAALALLTTSTLADEQPMKGPEVKVFLEGATVEGNQDGAAWSQKFAADGTTVYTTASGDQPGHWEVRGDKFCSNWPPATTWDCYEITGEGDNISFIPDGGGKPWPATRKAK